MKNIQSFLVKTYGNAKKIVLFPAKIFYAG